jgi:hypothetical protein
LVDPVVPDVAGGDILPWRPSTRQQDGRATEKRLLRERGARNHPASGAGKIKDDGSDDEHLYEVKDANASHTVKGDDLLALYQRGIRQGLVPVYLIRFGNGLILEGTIRADTGQ